MASSTKRAATSLMRPEPLVITTNWMMIRIRNTTRPTARLSPPTYSPKAWITLPALPWVRIRRVLATLSPRRKSVVKSRIVGKVESSRAERAFMTTRSSTSEIVMLEASSTSSTKGLIGVISVTISPSTPRPTIQSA